ncbi:MAG: hypothetical protein ACE5WD_08290 [Candidatus Aminicenantia bacterium]
MKSEKLNAKALGFSLAIYSALLMVILSILGILDLVDSAVEIMKSFHIGFSLSFVGIIIGIIEAAIFGFVSGVIIAFFYNRIG